MRRALPISLALLALAGTARAASMDEPQDPHRRAVVRVLATLEPGPFGPSDEGAVADRLRRLGAPAAAATLDVLEATAPGTREERALTLGLRELPADLLGAALHAHAAQGGSRGVERTLQLVARVGRADDLRVATELVRGLDAQRLADANLHDAWRRAVAGTAASGLDAREAESTLRAAPAALESTTLGAFVASGRRDLLALAAERLAWDGRDPGALMRSLADVPAARLAGLDVDRGLQRHLERGEPRVRKAAADLAAHLRSRALVPTLVEQLGHPDGGVRGAAQAALRRITDSTRAATPEAWQAWLDAEEAWLERSDLDARLHGDTVAGLGAALRDAAAHPWAAGALEEQVEALAGHEQAGVRLLAVSALRALGALDALPTLVEALQDPSPAVARGAHAALRDLTGERLGGDPAAWEHLLR